MSGVLLPAGEHAVLAEVGGLDEVEALRAAVRARVDAGSGPWGAVVDVVPGARTLLVSTRSADALGGLREALGHLVSEVDGAGTPPPVTGREVEMAVVYDGPDLAAVAEHTGLSAREVVAAHTGMPWRVAFGGFAPGFAYLVGGDSRLAVPRLDRPRAVVPAGSVALAGEFCGVYPRESPGGWQIVGRTDALLWDVSRERAALLHPGDSVRFLEVGQG